MKNGWQSLPLGKICQVIGGGTPSKSKAEYYGGKIPWATVRDMGTEVISETAHKITNEAVQNSSTNIIPAGNVVIATRVGLGKICLIENDTAINQDLRGIVPNDPKILSTRFLFSWLKSVAHLIVSEGTGATVQGVKLPFIKSLSVPLPPLPEQRRIVGILDEAFDGIATAKANAEKNLQNARALFESHLNAVFSQRGEGWVEIALSELCEIKHGFAFKGKEFSSAVPEGKPLVITPGNFTEDGKLLFNQKNTKRFNGEVSATFRFDVGDLVVVMTDLSSKMKILGKPAFVDTDNVLHNQRIGRVIFLKQDVEKRFLYYFFMSGRFLKNIRESATGTMVKHTAPKRILRNVLPFPPEYKKQLAVIETLDAIRDETQRLQSICLRKLNALDELKKSLLHQAFSGHL